jgi:hypothetical protein
VSVVRGFLAVAVIAVAVIAMVLLAAPQKTMLQTTGGLPACPSECFDRCRTSAVPPYGTECILGGGPRPAVGK